MENKTLKAKNQGIDTTVYQPDSLFNTMVVAHGLCAFSSSYFERAEQEAAARNNLLGLIKTMKEIDYFEICCAHKTQLLGDIGIYLIGDHRVVANRDIYSMRDIKNPYIRVWSRMFAEDIIEDINDYKLGLYEYTEQIVCPRKIVGIWIKRKFLIRSSLKFIRFIYKLAEENDWIIHVVER